jgi:hypothetical protein
MSNPNMWVPLAAEVQPDSHPLLKIAAILVVFGQIAAEIFVVGILIHLGWSVV